MPLPPFLGDAPFTHILQKEPAFQIEGLSRESLGGQQGQSLSYPQNKRRLCCRPEEATRSERPTFEPSSWCDAR